jgi:transmembrane sensor
MNNEQIYDLITSYLSGNTTPEERAQVDAWLEEREDNRQLFEDIRSIWSNSAANEHTFEPDVEAAWRRVADATGISRESTPVIPMQPRRSFNFRRIAAVLVLLLGSSFFLKTFVFDKRSIEVATIAGETRDVELPDGTHIWLNQNSALSYKKGDFNKKERSVTLSGEAFFEVAKNPEKPFIIQSSDTYTKVLGTSFNVRAYQGEETVEVSVSTGRVEFGLDKGDKVILTPGLKGTADTHAGTVQQAALSNENYLAWKNKKLLFNDLTIAEIIPALEHYFSVRIDADDAVLSCHFTGNFNDPQLIEVLQVLSLSTGIEYRANHNMVSLTGNGCK